MLKENHPVGHHPVHLRFIFGIISLFEGYGPDFLHRLSFPLQYCVKNRDKQSIIMFRIKTVSFVQITCDLVPEQIKGILIEEALLKHLCNDCHLCISRVSR